MADHVYHDVHVTVASLPGAKMAWTIEYRDGTIERELSAHQRGLVDTCLEEGQFESAIALMEQLRSPNYKPPMYVPYLSHAVHSMPCF